MIEIVQDAFWLTATAMISLIVPIVAIKIAFGLFFDGLYGGRK